MGQLVELTVAGKHLDLSLTGVAPDVAELVPLRLDWFLAPHAAAFFQGIEAATGVPLPDRLAIRFTGSPELIRARDDWPYYLPAGDRSGVRTVERILVQLACQARPYATAAEQHAITCPLIERRIDLTFICALEQL